MTQDKAPQEKKDDAPSPEEARLKKELDKARAEYAAVYRRVESKKKFVVGRLFLKEEEQLRKNEPLGELAQAWNTYDNALKSYLIEIRQTRGELAERRACAHEAEELIRDKRRLQFMVTFTNHLSKSKIFAKFVQGVMRGVEYVKKNPLEAALLASLILTLGSGALIATLPVAVLAAWAPYVGSAVAGIAVAVPLGFALRAWLESIDKRHEEKLVKAGKLTPEEIGHEMANRRRSVKFFSFMIALITGFGVRYGVRDALMTTNWAETQTGIRRSMSLEAQAAETAVPDETAFQKRFIQEQVAKWKAQGVPDAEIRERLNTIEDLFRKKAAFESRVNREANWLVDEDIKLGGRKRIIVDDLRRLWRAQGISEQEIDQRVIRIDETFNRKEDVIDTYGSRVIDSSKRLKQLYYLIDQGRLNDCAEEIQIAETQLNSDIVSAKNALNDLARYLDFLRQNPNQSMADLPLSYEGEGGRGRAVPLGYEDAESGTVVLPENISDLLKSISEAYLEPLDSSMADIAKKYARLYALAQSLEPNVPEGLSNDLTALADQHARMRVSRDALSNVIADIADECADSKQGEEWLIKNKDSVDARFKPLIESAKLQNEEAIKLLERVKSKYPILNTNNDPIFTDAGSSAGGTTNAKLSAPVVEAMAGSESGEILTGPVAEAIQELDSVIMAPVKAGYQQVLESIDLLDLHEPAKGTPAHDTWFALRNKLLDAKHAYEDILGGYSRLDDELSRLATLHPDATKEELLAMIKEDKGGVRGLKTLASLTEGTRTKTDPLLAESTRMAESLPERLGQGDTIEVGAEKVVTVPTMAELTKLYASLTSYIDTQAGIFKDMADGLARIVNARTSIATFRGMMVTEVLAFGKLAPKVQIDLEHVMELVRGGRATDAEIAAAYAKADAGMQELNQHAHAATQHYNRATIEVNGSVSEAGYETDGAGDTVELGSERIDQIMHPTDCQEYVARIGYPALRRLQLYFDSLPVDDARRPQVLAAMQRIEHIMGRVRDYSVSRGYIEATTASIKNLRVLAAAAELDIKRILRTTIPQDGRVVA